ncbi:phage minor head protein [Blautia faecis]|jgi:hypothetical protein|uniref:phage minor head protein n=1 Tax=Blautia faecis TaxID=871665 RepID=UPI0028A3FCFF|nr:phage minor head protein [Blautia faecis]MDT4368515.1 phage minor head protein [Blautia faecis]
MNKALQFDELNVLSENRRSEPYEEYFDKMSISDKQKRLRIAFSEQMEEVILFCLSLIETMVENEEVDQEYIENELSEQYLAIAAIYFAVDDYITDYVRQFSHDVVQSTFDHIKEEYYLSRDRAMFISECEANTSLNYKEYTDAIKSGKKYKTWKDIGDKRERRTHLEVGGTTIPIKELFAVVDSLMLFAKDTSHGASSKEIVNCRCSIQYS